jgi:aspartate aminotransferase-like enzyme
MSENYLLLNPGPTNTLKEVKDAQTLWSDVCHRTDSFLQLLNETKRKLLKRFDSQTSFDDWGVAIMGGSGTIAMESLISSLLWDVTIVNAGKYGQRAADIARVYDIGFREICCDNIEQLTMNPYIRNLYFVENETTTGETFELDKMIGLFPNARFFIDATSAFGASDYSNSIDKIDAISFCSNKCLQSTPGLGIVIWRKSLHIYSRTYYSNLQRYISNDDIPFTVPTQSVGALSSALNYSDNSKFDGRRDKVIKDFRGIGISCLNSNPSNSIIGFKHPTRAYDNLERFLLKRGIVIYSGIPNVENSFRIATMSSKFDDHYDLIMEAFYDSCVH